MARHRAADRRHLLQQPQRLPTGSGGAAHGRGLLAHCCCMDEGQASYRNQRRDDCDRCVRSLVNNGLNTFMELFILLTATFVLGWWLSSKFYIHIYTRILEKLNVDGDDIIAAAEELSNPVEEIPATKEVFFRLEQHEGSIFAYRLETDEFLAQSDEPQGIVDRLLERFPKGTKFHINDEDGADLIRHLSEVDNT